MPNLTAHFRQNQIYVALKFTFFLSFLSFIILVAVSQVGSAKYIDPDVKKRGHFSCVIEFILKFLCELIDGTAAVLHSTIDALEYIKLSLMHQYCDYAQDGVNVFAVQEYSNVSVKLSKEILGMNEECGLFYKLSFENSHTPSSTSEPPAPAAPDTPTTPETPTGPDPLTTPGTAAGASTPSTPVYPDTSGTPGDSMVSLLEPVDSHYSDVVYHRRV
ncbi:uncharacterized protein LOC119694146 [Plutella xylostella]|uniref:uncharacterized protein LOC119694146 n=1 Tax=Plutella xylostella TaxID=51655 RepID=UPI002032B0D4|nr:uncharacterized protein LOC119694146 [Plutella xylostella]